MYKHDKYLNSSSIFQCYNFTRWLYRTKFDQYCPHASAARKALHTVGGSKVKRTRTSTDQPLHPTEHKYSVQINMHKLQTQWSWSHENIFNDLHDNTGTHKTNIGLSSSSLEVTVMNAETGASPAGWGNVRQYCWTVCTVSDGDCVGLRQTWACWTETISETQFTTELSVV